MNQRLGIIGCGQLSQMLGQAARRLGVTVTFLCVGETPIVQGLGEIYTEDELDQFLDTCDAITVERENLPDGILRGADKVGLAPGYGALTTLRERNTQKATLNKLGIPTSPWRLINNRDELAMAWNGLGSKLLRAKRTLGGYDGGGQWHITGHKSFNCIPDDQYPVIVEAEINVERELALIIARDRNGMTVTYPITENFMRHGILLGSFAPATVTDVMAKKATAYVKTLADAINYIGVLAAEFFIADGELMVNEIAPRVHNTGHWTIGTIGADQFTQHVRLVLGGSVVKPEFTEAAAVINLLDSDLPEKMPDSPIQMLLQTYGKGIGKGRKLGHLTLVGSDASEVRAKAEALINEIH